MGLFQRHSSSYFDKPIVKETEDVRNPDPTKYKIILHKEQNGFLLVLINYPNCTNYEGNKILLYKGVTYNQLVSQKVIDPHFSENKRFKSPIARFEPTDYGWELGLKLMNIVSTST